MPGCFPKSTPQPNGRGHGLICKRSGTHELPFQTALQPLRRDRSVARHVGDVDAGPSSVRSDRPARARLNREHLFRSHARRTPAEASVMSEAEKIAAAISNAVFW